jgi:hypothetical protein
VILRAGPLDAATIRLRHHPLLEQTNLITRMRPDYDPGLSHFAAAARCRFGAHDWTSSAELYAAYRAFCAEWGLQPALRVRFSQFLASIGGVEPYRYAAARGYREVRLL